MCRAAVLKCCPAELWRSLKEMREVKTISLIKLWRWHLYKRCKSSDKAMRMPYWEYQTIYSNHCILHHHELTVNTTKHTHGHIQQKTISLKNFLDEVVKVINCIKTLNFIKPWPLLWLLHILWDEMENTKTLLPMEVQWLCPSNVVVQLLEL